jgi:hypothetical protein
MSDPTLSIRSERIACTDGLPMLSAHRCATRMDRSRESSSDSGYLKEKPQGLGPVPAQIDGACDAATHDQPRCVEVLLIANARRSSNRQPLTTKVARRLLAQSPSRPRPSTPGRQGGCKLHRSWTAIRVGFTPTSLTPRSLAGDTATPMVMSLLRAIVLRLLKWPATEIMPIALRCCCRSNHLRAASANL